MPGCCHAAQLAARRGPRFPIAPGTLHQIIGQSFTDALHGAFMTSGILLLIAAVLTVFLLKPQPRALPAAVETEEELAEAVLLGM